MARKTSEFLRAFGKAFEIFKALVDEVLSQGGDDGDVARILTDKSLRWKIGDLILSTKYLLPYNFRFVVNYDQPLDRAIKEGKYDGVDIGINSKHFPSSQTGQKEVELILYYFGDVSSEYVIAFGKKYGFRPATLPELLKLGAEQPELQRQFTILALGSLWVDRISEPLCRAKHLVSELTSAQHGRHLGIFYGFDIASLVNYRFAFVREQVT